MIPNGTIDIAFEQLPPAFQTLAFERAKERDGHPAVVGVLGESVVIHVIGETSNLHSVWITLVNDDRAIIAGYNALVMAGLFFQVFRGNAYLAMETVSRLLKIRQSAIVHIDGDEKRAIDVSIEEETGTITIGIIPKGGSDGKLLQ